MWAFKVKVTVSKNALKLRLFNRRTPFLTLTEGERNADKAPPGRRGRIVQQFALAFIPHPVDNQ